MGDRRLHFGAARLLQRGTTRTLAGMMLTTISIATEEEVRSGVLGRRLREFNYGFVGEYPETRPIWLNAKGAEGIPA